MFSGRVSSWNLRDQHMAELPNHVTMLESDTGVFRPTGFGFSGTEAGLHLLAWLPEDATG